jgi:hypothetical protein
LLEDVGKGFNYLIKNVWLVITKFCLVLKILVISFYAISKITLSFLIMLLVLILTNLSSFIKNFIINFFPTVTTLMEDIF